MHFNKKAGIEVQRMGSKTEHIENKDHMNRLWGLCLQIFSPVYNYSIVVFNPPSDKYKTICTSLPHISIHET